MTNKRCQTYQVPESVGVSIGTTGSTSSITGQISNGYIFTKYGESSEYQLPTKKVADCLSQPKYPTMDNRTDNEIVQAQLRAGLREQELVEELQTVSQVRRSTSGGLK